MKIKILHHTHHRVSSGMSQAFKAGTKINLPKTVAEELIARNLAAPDTDTKPSTT